MLEENNGPAQRAQGNCVPEDVDEPHLHGLPSGRFHAGDIGDGSNMVVVESMTEAQYTRRNKCKIQGV
jgi:hypothetical protein